MCLSCITSEINTYYSGVTSTVLHPQLEKTVYIDGWVSENLQTKFYLLN